MDKDIENLLKALSEDTTQDDMTLQADTESEPSFSQGFMEMTQSQAHPVLNSREIENLLKALSEDTTQDDRDDFSLRIRK